MAALPKRQRQKWLFWLFSQLCAPLAVQTQCNFSSSCFSYLCQNWSSGSLQEQNKVSCNHWQGCGSATCFCDCHTKKKIIKKLVTWLPVTPSCIKPGQTQKLCFVDYTKCRSTLLIWIWIALCLCTALFFLPYSAEPNLVLTVEKPMFVQVEKVCTSHLSSGTALQQILSSQP